MAHPSPHQQANALPAARTCQHQAAWYDPCTKRSGGRLEPCGQATPQHNTPHRGVASTTSVQHRLNPTRAPREPSQQQGLEHSAQCCCGSVHASRPRWRTHWHGRSVELQLQTQAVRVDVPQLLHRQRRPGAAAKGSSDAGREGTCTLYVTCMHCRQHQCRGGCPGTRGGLTSRLLH